MATATREVSLGGMVPPREALPDVLPTERLTASGKAVGALRSDLRRIPDLRNAVSVAGAYVQSFGVIAAAVAIDHPLAWIAAFLLMGRAHALFAILSHEAAHRLLFSRRWLNDVVGRWVLGYPSIVAFDLYRRAHLTHHRDELGPEEPDLLLYAGYPLPSDSFRRKLLRDAFFVSGSKNLRSLVGALRRPASRRFAAPIVLVQVFLLAGFTVAGRPELYLFLWLAPWMSVWKVLNRLRAVAEHGGMAHSDDRRMTTHVVRQSRLARFWVVPYNTGWHLAHHVDMGVPFRNLPRFHAELVRSGWVPEAIEHRSYLRLWRTLASGA